MANFDLISEDDFFSGEQKKKPDQEVPEKSQPDEDLFARPLPELEDDILAPEETPDESLDLDDISGEETIPQDFSEDVKDNFDFSGAEAESTETEIPDEVPPEPEAMQTTQEEEAVPDYYDDKQKQISYKPIVIGIVIVLLLAVLLYLGKIFFFDASGTSAPKKEKTEKITGKTKKPSSEDVRKTKFFAELAGKTQYAASNITRISGAVLKNARLSSVLFYGTDFTFEAFAKTRAGLAKLNIKLKEDFKNYNIKIVSSQDRPGANGGVFGVYKMTLSGTGGAAASAVGNPFKSLSEAKNWLSFLMENGALKMKALKSRSLGRRNGFDAVEIDASVYGSREQCLQLIKSIGDANRNCTISKLSLNAVDQRNFNSKKYQTRLILQVYL